MTLFEIDRLDDFPAAAASALAVRFGAQECVVRTASQRTGEEIPDAPREVSPKLRDFLDREWGLSGSPGEARHGPRCEAELLALPFFRGSELEGMAALRFPRPDDAAAATPQLSRIGAVLALHLARLRTLDSLARIDHARHRELQLDIFLEHILDRLVDGLGYVFGAVALANPRRREIRYVQCRNVPAGWRTLSRYLIDESNDILVDVFKSGKTERIVWWDERFNEDIYRKFAHDTLARVWTPIYAGGEIAGVLEAGGPRHRESDLLNADRVERVKALAREQGWTSLLNPPERALDLVAERMRNTFGGEACGITVWRDGDCLADAWSGPPIRFDKLDRRQRELYAACTDTPEWRRIFGSEGENGVFLARRLKFADESHGLVAVYSPSPGQFPEREIRSSSWIARLNSLLSGDLTRSSVRDALDKTHTLASLRDLSPIVKGDATLDEVLRGIADRAVLSWGADSVCIYECFADRNLFGVLRAWKGKFRVEPYCMELPYDIVTPVLGAERHLYARDVRDTPLAERRSDGAPRFAEVEQLKSCAVLRLLAGAETVGLMFLNFRTERQFPRSFQREAEALANTAAAAISIHRLAERNRLALKRSSMELERLRVIDDLIVRTLHELNPTEVAGIVLDSLLALLECDAGCIFEMRPGQSRMELTQSRGFERRESWIPSPSLGSGEALLTGRERLVPDTAKEPGYCELVPGMGSELAVPFFVFAARDEAKGVVSLLARAKGHFAPGDIPSVRLFLSRLAFAERVAYLYSAVSNQIIPRITFGRIAARIQDSSWDLTRSLRFVLAGITAEEGLGFSRALLFLADEDADRLRGHLAVGAVTADEAEATWKTFERARSSRPLSERLEFLLEDVDMRHNSIRGGLMKDSGLSAAVSDLDWPLADVRGSLGRALASTVASVVDCADMATDWFGQELSRTTGVETAHHPCWIAPLVTAGKCIGLVVVDNRFMQGREDEVPAQEKIRTLEAFAELAAMNVENARLREHVRTETYEELNHQIRNPLNNARFLVTHLINKGLDHKELAAAATQLDKAQWVASNVKLFADMSLGRNLSGALRDSSVARAIALTARVAAVVDQLEKRRRTRLAVCPDGCEERTIRWDEQLFEQALVAVLENASQYSESEVVHVDFGARGSSFEIVVRNDHAHLSDEELARCRKMRGRGTRARRERPGGSGLGLAIAAAVATAHGGALDIESPGDSVRVTLSIPFSDVKRDA